MGRDDDGNLLRIGTPSVCYHIEGGCSKAGTSEQEANNDVRAFESEQQERQERQGLKCHGWLLEENLHDRS